MMTAEQALRQFTAIDSPDLVADVLLDMGITGRRRQYDACPVTQYLERFCGPGWKASPLVVWNQDNGAPPTRLPRVVGQFIAGFDQGDYPMLEG